MTELALTKHHGLGNDFLVSIRELSVDRAPDGEAANLARRLCDRQTGIGADGLIFATNLGDGSPVARWQFRLFNSDGSGAEVSGNGLRCFGQAIAMHLGEEFVALVAETLAGQRNVNIDISGGGPDGNASVSMGKVTPGPAVPDDLLDRVATHGGHLDLAPTRWATGDIGNPHIVFEVADPEVIDLPTFGAAVEAVLGGINVHVVAPAGPNEITMRVWERGAGITQACGSGASVVAHVANRWGLVAEKVQVHMPGGSATVVLDGDEVTLIGGTTYVGRIEVPHG